MKHFTHSTKLLTIGIVISTILLSATASAQTRAFGAGALVLDDGLGQTITLQTPIGGWTGNIPFIIPIPPPGNPTSGFVYTGTAAGQLLSWVMPPGGGPQGSWQPISVSSIGAVTGTGTAGTFPIWTGGSSQGNSALGQNYNNSVAPYAAGNAGEQLFASGPDGTISIALQPAGYGALEAQIADNTTAGGTLRGPNAVDWQMSRGVDTEVASGYYSTLSGGQSNTASSYYGTVSGGAFNSADYGNYATVSGGGFNTANGGSSTVSGGALNISSNAFTTVSGGYSNTASANSSTVSGGVVNIASGDYSTIPGGEHLTLSGYDDFGFLSLNDGAGNAMSISANNTSVFGNTDLWLANNDNTARALYFYAPYNGGAGAFPNGDNYVGFRAGVVTTSVIWTLPVADGASGQALVTDGTGTLSWGAAGLYHITENYNNSVAPYTAGNAGEQLLASGADETISITLQSKGFGSLEAQLADNTTVGGNLRGANAVDWQMSRGVDTQVASGSYATVSGGNSNTASGYSSTVSGGYSNSAVFGNYATVSGGAENTANGGSSTVSGGALNISSNAFTTVSGGYSNTASANSSTVSGGVVNIASGDYSTIPGGEHLTLSGYDDFGFLSLNDGAGNAMSISANNTAVFGNTDLWLANNDNTARALYFYAPYNGGAGAFPNDDNYVGFRAGVVTTSVIWTLPLADGMNGQALVTDGSGTLSWGAAGTGSIVPISSSTTVGTGVSEVVCSGTSNINVTLPAASSYASGTEIDFIWVGDGTHTATIQPGGADALVMGTGATATIQSETDGWNSLGVKSNGTNTWYYCHQ